MISHKYKTVVIHIPKTAGTSIQSKLMGEQGFKRGQQDHRTIKQIRPLTFLRHFKWAIRREFSIENNLGRKEMLRAIFGLSRQSEKRLTAKQFSTYLKVAVVRNPWGRVYSWYKNVQRDELHGVPKCSFSVFLQQHGDNWALKPQLYWIADFDNKIPLDRVIRFEELSEELPALFKELGFAETEVEHLLKSQNEADYREIYSEKEREWVASRYREEIDMFGYEF